MTSETVSEFMERTGVVPLLQSVLQECLVRKPDDHLAFLVHALKAPPPGRVVVLGPPGSGKSSVSHSVAARYGVVRLSASQLLRREVRNATAVGQEVKRLWLAGKPVPDRIAIPLVLRRLQERDCATNGYVLSGFPATRTQAESLARSGLLPDVALFLNLPDERVAERIKGRRVDPTTNRVYHIEMDAPDSFQTIRRLEYKESDMQPDGHANRLDAFHRHFPEVKELVEGMLFSVDASQSIAEIWGSIMAHLDRRLPLPPEAPKRLIIFGPPGAGKTTQARILEKQFGLVNVSSGELLSEEMRLNPALAEKIQATIADGHLVADDIITPLVLRRLQEADCTVKGWLLEGFPRTKAQADALTQVAPPDLVIVMELSERDALERNLERRTDPDTGTVYHLTFDPPEDYRVMRRLTRRADDSSEEKVRVRLAKYKKHVEETVACFSGLAKAVHAKLPKSFVARRFESLIATTRPIHNQGPVKPLHMIITGPPAAGKGTQCEFIREEVGVVHISTGDLLRFAVSQATELGLKAKTFMDEGLLVPDNLVIALVRERLQQPDCQKHGWLLDGYPRTRAQADALTVEGIRPDIFVLLVCPDDVVVDRIEGRRLDPLTGKIYHLTFDPPPDDPDIQQRLQQRDDDTEDKVRVRLRKYHENIQRIAECYNDVLFRVNAKRPKSDVFEDIRLAIQYARV